MYNRYFKGNKRCTLSVLAIAVSMLLAACGSAGTTSQPSASSSQSSAATTSARQVSYTVTSATATLTHMPVGSATIDWSRNDQMATVQVILTGLAPSSVHPVHIHSGSCGQDGRILYPLLNLTADAHGVANATTKLTLPRGIPASGWSIDVHNGPGLSNSDQALPIACGNVINHDASLRSNQSVQVPLTAPATAPNQAVKGTATLSLSNRQLTVRLMLSGLQPGSEHAAHIHAGTCASQGPVVYGLPMIKADASGKVALTAVIPNVSSIPANGWYVNVHRSSDLSTQTGFDPIACGNVVPTHR